MEELAHEMATLFAKSFATALRAPSPKPPPARTRKPAPARKSTPSKSGPYPRGAARIPYGDSGVLSEALRKKVEGGGKVR